MRSANSEISITPIQNVGTAMPSCEVVFNAKPSSFLWRNADNIPTGSAMSNANTDASAISGNVTVAFAAISSAISAPVSMDVPKSPRTAFVSQSAYCTTAGLSKP